MNFQHFLSLGCLVTLFLVDFKFLELCIALVGRFDWVSPCGFEFLDLFLESIAFIHPETLIRPPQKPLDKIMIVMSHSETSKLCLMEAITNLYYLGIKVLHMRDGTIPPMWNKMYKNSEELATNKMFDLAESWFKKLTEASDDPITDLFVTGLVPKDSAKQPNLTSAREGVNMVTVDANVSHSMPRSQPITDPFVTGLVLEDAAKQPNLTSSREGVNMVTADASASHSMPRSHYETLKKAVSFADAQQISTDAVKTAPGSKLIKEKKSVSFQ